MSSRDMITLISYGPLSKRLHRHPRAQKSSAPSQESVRFEDEAFVQHCTLLFAAH